MKTQTHFPPFRSAVAAWLTAASLLALTAAPLPAQESPPPDAVEAPVPPVEAAGDVLPPVEASEAAPAVPEPPAAPALEVEAPQTPVESSGADVVVPPVESAPRRIDRRDMVSIGGGAHLRSNETSADMITVMGSAIVDGEVRGDSVTVLGNVTINGSVNRDLVCVMGRITLGPEAEIRGDVVAVGGLINAAPGAVIRGEKIEVGIFGGFGMPSFEWLSKWLQEGLFKGRLYPHTSAAAWTAAGVVFVLGILLYALFRRPVEAAASALERKPAMALVNGILAMILLGPLMFILLVSVVGILVIPFLFAGMFLAGVLGLLGVYRHCGGQMGLKEFPFVALLVGHALFLVLYAVPIVGLPLFVIASLVGQGAVFTALLESMRRESRPPKPPGGNGHRAAVPSPAAPPPQPAAMPATATSSAAPAAGFFAPPGLPVSEAIPASHVPGAIPPLPLVPGTTERVGFWPRLGATALDFLLVGGLTTFLSMQFLFPYVWLVYHIGFWAWRATTIGGIVLNLRIERLDGRKVDPGVATVRSLGSIFSGMVLGLGFMWASWDEERQSWHDKIAGTTIVRVPRGQPLF